VFFKIRKISEITFMMKNIREIIWSLRPKTSADILVTAPRGRRSLIVTKREYIEQVIS